MYPAASPPSEAAVIVADRYELLNCLGTGGMGVVHRARDLRTGAIVAIKRPRFRDLSGLSSNFDPQASLAREHVALSALGHVNIVRAHDFGQDQAGEPFLSLDLLEWPRPINAYGVDAKRRGRLRALIEMFEAIAFVHRSGWLHRDIKPSNVIVCRDVRNGPHEDGVRACLIDFGLALRPGETTTPAEDEDCGPPSLVGSALYLAPELVGGAVASIASDLYAAGMVAAEVLTGVDPLDRAGPRPTLSTLRDFPQTWLAACVLARRLDPRAASLLHRLLARDPKDRCAGAEEAIRELEAIAEGD